MHQSLLDIKEGADSNSMASVNHMASGITPNDTQNELYSFQNAATAGLDEQKIAAGETSPGSYA